MKADTLVGQATLSQMEEAEDFDFDDEDGMFDFDIADGDDFGDDNTLNSIIEAYHKTPPLTKAYLTASFGAAILGYMTDKNNGGFPSILQLEWNPICNVSPQSVTIYYVSP